MPTRKTSFQDIAELAGVSPSTVDRVMNGRAGVSAVRRRKVIEAARQLGSNRLPAVPDDYALRVLVVRTAEDDEYFARMDRALDEAAAALRPRVELTRVHHVRAADGLGALIREASRHCHGMIVLAHDGAEIRKALGRVAKAEVPIATLTSDITFQQQRTYVGIDNVAAGRSAAFMMSRFMQQPGRVLLMTGPQSYVVHRQRTAGFVEGLAQHAPWLQLIGPVDVGDVNARAQTAMRNALHGHSRLVGVYNTGGANDGVRAVLEGLSPAERPLWFTHETHPGNVDLLRRGVMSLLIDQDPAAQAVVGLQSILYANGEIARAPDPHVRFHLVTMENIESARALPIA
ncbi:transcriptional regulator, LacI family [Pseudoxanthomonas sp. GM95]|uniref:LacI family DNA-binding transcriptional regulator n=1 Tax=Pseudoxanthomonas sp. GM95 TaxID=1881043 RepID=UPI0008B93A79|nr:LacI family DNA-binding transcriptional regulator [Pseudoxanthomonas sp. GM95]SEM18581.1 transcriptional regulator, LacI family [Pseudoxanthomonas sp. GM95]